MSADGARMLPPYLWRRWEPGQGYDGYAHGLAGLWNGLGDLGDDCPTGSSMSADGVCEPDFPVPTDVPFGTASDCEDITLWASTDVWAKACPAYADLIPSPGGNVMTGGLPTAAQIAKTATPGGLMTPALAAAISTGLRAGTMATAAPGVCPSGYLMKATGQCVGGTGPVLKLPGQWFSFATNQQIVTFGLVIGGALLLVKLIPSGGRRGR